MSARSRSAIYEGLKTVVDEEAVEEMLSNFPARDVDEPVTKDFLRAELAEGFSKADARLQSSMKWMIATMLALWSLQLTAIVVFR